MARPNKNGLDYFPLDVDFLEDEKMLAISGEFSVKGEIITLRLLCEIYRNGYFVEYSGLLKNKLARLGGLSSGLVDEVVKKLVGYNFFDEAMFREYNVLTSNGIQKRFDEATKRRKDVDKSMFWIQKSVNVNNNVVSSVVNVNINSQSKEKVNKSKEKKYIKKVFNFYESLLKLGCKKQFASEWLEIRRLKKMKNTETAFNRFKNEIDKSGFEINHLMEKFIIPKSWGGFEAKWLDKEKIKHKNIENRYENDNFM